MNIRLQNPNPLAAGRSLLSANGMMKSTAQKLERQAKRDSQVAFFENQKANLKNIECSSPEEVARVLELLHSYEDQIAAAKAEYNNAQMFHLMDEAKERGEEIAKAIEDSEPKTAEERKKEAVEEALGIEEEKGLLDDILDQVADKAAEARGGGLSESGTGSGSAGSGGYVGTGLCTAPGDAAGASCCIQEVRCFRVRRCISNRCFRVLQPNLWLPHRFGCGFLFRSILLC